MVFRNDFHIFPHQVFPHEYRRALRTIKEEEKAKEVQKRAAENGELTNGDDKVEANHVNESPVAKKSKKEPTIQDIESTIPDTEMEQKWLDKALDKTRYV